jgi:DNA-binding MarR family transcriptional regulator
MITDGHQSDRPTGLAGEIGKRRPFESQEEEAYLNLLRTMERLARPIDALFRREGLSEAKYNALRILRGRAGAGVPSQQIADDMVTRHPDITRLIDRLETDGLVERDRDPDDRRRVIVRLTSAGRAKVDALDAPLRELHLRQFAGLSREDLHDLNRLLVAARESAAAADDAPTLSNGSTQP